MKETLEYRGHYGSVEFDKERKVYYGKILHISEFIPYETVAKEKLEIVFREKVEDYLISQEDVDPDFPDFE